MGGSHGVPHSELTPAHPGTVANDPPAIGSGARRQLADIEAAIQPCGSVVRWSAEGVNGDIEGDSFRPTRQGTVYRDGGGDGAGGRRRGWRRRRRWERETEAAEAETETVAGAEEEDESLSLHGERM